MITTVQRNNLKKLALYLMNEVSESKFEMGIFFGNTDLDLFSEGVIYPHDVTPELYSVCGTVACVAGHGPMAGIPGLPNENWMNYIRRAFGDSIALYEWAFNANWRYRDNTARGAALRIFWFLEHGIPPNRIEMFSNRVPLIYKDYVPNV